ncbi:MAG: hypothetical protein Q8R92_17010 [Deltaproteobacteria bacterium]|nr:hypothetical protein [Deltaproteobacteria bacterium]
MPNEPKPPIIKREISVGDIISLIVAIAAVVVAYGKLDTRITVVETTQIYQSKSNDTFQVDVKTALKDITDKIGAVAERLPRK